MNAVRLLAYYEQIADAPDAIARLRRFILDLAVRGKVVEQDPNDVPASELLKRIAVEKARLVKAGEFLEPRNAVDIKRDELPFVPAVHWEWSRLIDIARPSYGFAFQSSEFNTDKRGMPLIRIRDISKTDTAVYYEGDFDPTCLVRAGDYLVGMDGDFNLRRWQGRDGLLNQRVMRINGWRCDVDPEFVKLPLQMVLDYLHGVTSLTTVKHLSAKQVNGIEIPLPPLSEQHRIVAKLDELMGLCDRLEAARTEREAMRDRMGAASLIRLNDPDPDPVVFRNHAAFAIDNLTTLTTRTDQIKAMRQTILNLAVRGKLVPQDPNDEPASELVKRIAKEKARLAKAGVIGEQKALPSLANAKTSFELPQGWVWTRLGHLSQLVTSGSRDWAKHYSNEGAIFLRMGNLSKDHYHLRLEHIQRVKPPANSEGTRTRLEDGDICISITGDVGMLGLIPEGFSESYINQHTALVRPMPELKGRYLAEMFRSPFAQQQFNEPQRGIKNSFRLTDVTQFAVPLPPLAEQRRIVANVDRLLALCAQLEARLTSSNQARRLMLEALLQEALAPSAEIIRQDSSTITQQIPDKPRGRHKVLTEPTPIGTSPK